MKVESLRQCHPCYPSSDSRSATASRIFARFGDLRAGTPGRRRPGKRPAAGQRQQRVLEDDRQPLHRAAQDSAEQCAVSSIGKGSLEIGSAENFRDKILAADAQGARRAPPNVANRLHRLFQRFSLANRTAAGLSRSQVHRRRSIPSASITGATYLLPFLMGKDPAMVHPDVNWYVPGPLGAN